MVNDFIYGKKEMNFWLVVVFGLAFTLLSFVIAGILVNQLRGFLGFVTAFLCAALGCLSLYYLVWENIYRFLADLGWFWVRIPAMHAVFVEKDRVLYKVLINVSGEFLNEWFDFVERKNREAGYERFVLVTAGNEIVWIGLPWIYRLKTPWYEHSADVTNPSIEPTRFLDLRERTIDLPGGPDGVVPDVDSADPVQIRVRMIVSLKVSDPERALYNVQFFLEAIQNEIAARWREVISQLSYFHRVGKEGDLEVNPVIQQEASEKLSERLGLPYFPSTKEKKKTSAQIISEDWGVELLRVEIRDLDPADEKVREAIQEKSRERARAAARLQEARGEKAYKEMVALGSLAEERARREGVALGLKAIAKIIQQKGGDAALAADTAVRVAEGTENLITEGGLAGIVAQMMRVAETLKSSNTAGMPPASPPPPPPSSSPQTSS